MYTCKICGKEFSYKGGLGGHMKYHHPKNPVQICKICGRTFDNGGLSGHMSVSHPKGGVPHPGAIKLTKVWGTTKEEYDARMKLTRDSRFKYLDDIELDEFQRQMILGSLLGDMSIWKQHKGVSGTSNPELRISHSTKQKDYVMWKYDILKNIARKEPYEIIQKTGFGVGFGSCRFETRSLRCLNPIYNLVVGEDGKKHITQKWLDQIADPVALAVWYMDDGGYGGVWIAMGLTLKDELSVVANWLQDKWKLDSRITYSKSGYNDNMYAILRMSSKDGRYKFRELVRPYVIPTMKYKLH